MLPPKLFSTYQEYKRDTDVIASWLASTALGCGYPADRLKHPTTAAPSGRLKGKQRKEAKRAQQDLSSQKQNDRPKHAIAMAEFAALAEFIASSKSTPTSLPKFFVEALNRVITLRSGFPEQMAAAGMRKDPVSDEKHGYFVQVLEQVRTILRPFAPILKQEGLPVHNAFEALELHEPSQTFLDAPISPKPDPNDQPTPDSLYETEQSNALEELMFAWTMMINDLCALRKSITDIWLKYRQGCYDPAVAALATNTAMDLARNIMDEVLPLTIPFGAHWEAACGFFEGQCHAHGLVPIIPGLDEGGWNYETYDIANDTLFGVRRILLFFKKNLIPTDRLRKKGFPMLAEGQFGVYDPNSDREIKTGRQKAQEDKVLLTELFTEQAIVFRLLPDYPIKDEFLRGMEELDKTGEIPFYLAFAAQVHLDIHHVLREHASTACEMLLKAAQVFDDEITAHLEHHKALKSKHWPAQCDEILHAAQREIQVITSDPIHKLKTKSLKDSGIDLDPDQRPHLLLSMSPVVAGLWLFRLRARSWKIGMQVNQAWGSILCSAHLCNALKSERALTTAKVWKDMAITHVVFGSGNFYVGDRPKTRPDYLSNFSMFMGMSAAAFTQPGKKGQRTPTLRSKAGPRTLHGDASVSKMFFARYLEDSGPVDWTPEHVNDIISRSRYKPESSKSGFRPAQTYETSKATKQEAVDDTPISAPDLIDRLARSLQNESFELSFLYLRMHRECWEFLRAIRDACDPVLRRQFAPGYLEHESHLPFVVSWILQALILGRGSEDAESLLESCARVVEDMVERGDGAAVCRGMTEMGFCTKFKEDHEDV